MAQNVVVVGTSVVCTGGIVTKLVGPSCTTVVALPDTSALHAAITLTATSTETACRTALVGAFIEPPA